MTRGVLVLVALVLSACGGGYGVRQARAPVLAPPSVHAGIILVPQFQSPRISDSTTPGSWTSGDTVATTNGTWLNSPTSFAYQWQDCSVLGASCSNISAATASTYTLGSSDLGGTVRSVVTATNVFGSTSAASAVSGTVVAGGGPAPVNTIAPYFADDTTAIQGNTLSVSNGTWTNSPSSFSYQWQDCTTTGGQPPTTASCSNIASATGSSYVVQVTDSGKAIVPIVTAINGGGSTPTSVAGGCNDGAIPGNADTGGITTFTNTDPQLGAGCSPISAVSAATTANLKFCTNAPATCGFNDPLNQTAGVPAGTSVSTVSSLTCNGGNATPSALNVTSSVTIAAGCVSISNSFLPAGIEGNGISMTFNHDDIAGTHTGNWWNYQCTFTPGSEQSGGGADQVVHGGVGPATSITNSFLHCAAEPMNGFWSSFSGNYVISDECWGNCGEGNHTCRFSGTGTCGTTHNEAIYNFGGVSTAESTTNSVVYNSYPQTAAIFMDGGTGGQRNQTVTGNLFAYTGPSNGALILGGCSGTNSGNTATGNRFSFGFSSSPPAGGMQAAGGTWSGNFRDDTLGTVANNSGC